MAFSDEHCPNDFCLDERLGDELLNGIASDIETDEHAETLGIALGFKRASAQRYIATNLVTGSKTCKGTCNMLYDWRQRTTPNEQLDTLRRALIESGMIMLAERHFKNKTGKADMFREYHYFFLQTNC